MKKKNLLFQTSLLSFVLLLFFAVGLNNAAMAQATVQTDKDDYQPGEIVIITGSYFWPDEGVDMVIQHMNFPEHGDDYVYSLTDEFGSFVNSDYVIDAGDVGELFKLTATGVNSGYSAITYFTDGDAFSGDGTMIVTPVFVCGGGTGLTFTFSFNGGNGNHWNADSYLTMDVPWIITTSQVTTSNPVRVTIGTISTAPSSFGTLITIPFASSTDHNNEPTFNIVIAGPGVNMPSYSIYTIPVLTAQAGIGPILIAVPPTIGSGNTNGILLGSQNSCTTISNGTLTLFGYTGTIQHWEKRELQNLVGMVWGPWVIFPSGGTQDSYNLNSSYTVTTQFRVAATGASCGTPEGGYYYSETATVAISSAPAIAATNISSPGIYLVNFGVNYNVNVYSLRPPEVHYYLNYGLGNQQEIFSPYTFPVGATTVTVTAINSCYGVSYFTPTIATFTVSTGIPPQINCPAAITQDTDPGVCNAMVTYSLSWDGAGITTPPTLPGHYIGDPQPAISYNLDGGSTYTTGTGSGLTYQKGPTTVYLKASNAAGDAYCDFTITVEDKEAPTFTAPADITIYRDATCGYDASVTATGDVEDEDDNCSVGEATFLDDVNATNSCEVIITRTWSLVDDNGNYALDQVQTITVEDNTPPTFTRPIDITIYRDADCLYDASVTATGDVEDEDDNCGVGEATYADDVNATDLCAVIITRTWSLVDNCGNPAEDQVQTITVEDNTPPTFTRPIDITIYRDANCLYDASVTATGDVEDEDDNCGVGEATYADDVNATDPCAVIITRTWSLVDNCGNPAEDQVQTITVEDNTPPTFTRPIDITIYRDADCLYDASVTATGDVEDEDDNCGVGEATYADDVNATDPCAVIITRTWSLVDNCGNPAEDQVQTITVEDNTPPTFTRPIDITIYRDADCLYDASVTATGDVEDEDDNCGVGEATYADDVNATDPCAVIITRTWSLVDNCGNPAEDQVQTITVEDNTPPTFTRPIDITIYRDANCLYDASVTATGDVEDEDDNCGVGEATYADDVNATDPCAVIITRTWSLMDNCGNPAEDQVQTITVEDNTPPTFTRPIDITIYRDADCLYDASVTATGDVEDEDDNCGVGEATYADDVNATDPCAVIITRTWSLVDNCGNPAEDQVQTITVEDNTPPTFTRPIDITIYRDANCLYDASITATGDVEDEDDNCGVGEATYVDDVNATDPCAVIITRTWSLVDNCGNPAEDQVQTITVEDNTPPTFTRPIDITIYRDADCLYDASVTATGDVEDEDDNCGVGEATYDDVIDETDPCEVIITRTWSLVDNCGNPAEDQVQIITVEDNTPPEFNTDYCGTTVEKETIPGECTFTTGPDFNITATDNCSGSVIPDWIIVDAVQTRTGSGSMEGIVLIPGTTSITITAADDCGNESSCAFTVEVQIKTTTTVYTSAPSARYMDEITLYAEVVTNCPGYLLTGNVEFFIDGESVGSAPAYVIPPGEPGAGNTLRATLIHTIDEMPILADEEDPESALPHPVTAFFTPDGDLYLGSDGETELIIFPRNADPFNGTAGFYTGDLYGWTTSQNSNTATVTLATVIKDNNIPTGDVRGALVTFCRLNSDGSLGTPIPSAQNLPVGLVDQTDGTVGTASAIVQLNIGNQDAVDFQIAVCLSGGYTNNPLDLLSIVTVTVSRPVPGGYILGGGHIVNPSNSAGLIRGALDYRTEYSFNVKYTKKGSNPQGRITIEIRSWYKPDGTLDNVKHHYFAKSTAIASCNINGNTATFTSKANLMEHINGSFVTIEGNSILQVWMTDLPSPGGNTGQVGIQINKRSGGGLWFSSSWNGTKTLELPITSCSELLIQQSGSSTEAEPPIITDTENEPGTFTVYPNPYADKATFQFVPETDGRAKLELFDMTGRLVETLYEGSVTAGEKYEIEYLRTVPNSTMIIYRFTLGDKITTGKLLRGNF